MENLQLKVAQIDDLPFIVEVYNSTIKLMNVTADLSPVSIESRISWFHEHHVDRHPLWIITDNEEKIGWLSFGAFYKREAYNQTVEVSLYLHENVRRKGFGQEILKLAEFEAKKINIKNLLAFIFRQNVASIKLFEKVGYESWGVLPSVANMGNFYHDLIILGKKI